jgi:hypothetical protein
MIEKAILLDHIIKECQKIQGEILLKKALMTSDEDDNTNPFNNAKPLSVIEFMEKVIENSDKDRNFTKFLDYSTGKFDAYQDMLKLIGDNTDKQSDA